ncbi:MAG: threonine/serine ThrE exporter family protein [Lysobacteraceae bacterium]
MPEISSSFIDRTDFILELARRLHAYGTTAQRLERGINAVSQRLQVECEIWSNPTGIILSFSDPMRGPFSDTTRVIRLEPGDIDLRKLCRVDAIAEQVLNGEIGIDAGRAALRELDQPPGRWGNLLMALSFGLAGASVAGILRTGWADIATAAVIGTLIGALQVLSQKRPQLAEANDAIAALLATFLAAVVATYLVPLSLRSVVVASVIVLMPGLMLTNAVSELTSQHLVSGTARFAGAMATLIKLTFGTVAAMQAVRLLGWSPEEAALVPPPVWVEWAALALGAFAFAVLFRAQLRDYPLVMASAAVGYGITRWVGGLVPDDLSIFPIGVFLGGLFITMASNLYARWFNRPGALIRVPGIILLVPGSTGFRTLTQLMENDMAMGLDTAFVLFKALVALVAGVLFGNLLVSARRSL